MGSSMRNISNKSVSLFIKYLLIVFLVCIPILFYSIKYSEKSTTLIILACVIVSAIASMAFRQFILSVNVIKRENLSSFFFFSTLLSFLSIYTLRTFSSFTSIPIIMFAFPLFLLLTLTWSFFWK